MGLSISGKPPGDVMMLFKEPHWSLEAKNPERGANRPKYKPLFCSHKLCDRQQFGFFRLDVLSTRGR